MREEDYLKMAMGLIGQSGTDEQGYNTISNYFYKVTEQAATYSSLGFEIQTLTPRVCVFSHKVLVLSHVSCVSSQL